MALPQTSRRLCAVAIRQTRFIPIQRRLASTAGFFNPNTSAQQHDQSTTTTTTSPLRPATQASLPHLRPPSRELLTVPSYNDVAELLNAIKAKDQETAWMIYSVLDRAQLLHSLQPIHFSALLKTIRPANPKRFTQDDIAVLTQRFEKVWDDLRSRAEGHSSGPDMLDYTARLEFFVKTRQYPQVDKTWQEIREIASRPGDLRHFHPTLFTYNLILQSCGPRRDLNLAMETMAQMRRAGIHPDNRSWNFLLKVQSAVSHWEGVEASYRTAFFTKGTINPPTTHRMAISLGYRAESLHGGSFQDQPLAKDAQPPALSPTLENVHTLFSYYAYTQDLDQLQAMVDVHVRLFGFVPTTRTYNELIKNALVAGRDDYSIELFRELVKVGENLARLEAAKAAATKNGPTDHQQGEQPPNGEEAAATLAMSTTTTTTTTATTTTSSSVAAVPTTPATEEEIDLIQRGPDTPNETPILSILSSTAALSSTVANKGGVHGPDFYTFQILIANEASHKRWSRAWRWLRLMQEKYGLEPSDSMFKRTLGSMQKKKIDPVYTKALADNWRQVRRMRAAKAGLGHREPTTPQQQQHHEFGTLKDEQASMEV
ncbi:hypothetical protein DFQ26_000202 [Actinomortierella ambigua]|nr:hypothetical protein DFQ26_000202 [Actinomortierella ambigua]